MYVFAQGTKVTISQSNTDFLLQRKHMSGEARLETWFESYISHLFKGGTQLTTITILCLNMLMYAPF